MIKENKVSQSIESLAKVVNIAKVTIGLRLKIAAIIILSILVSSPISAYLNTIANRVLTGNIGIYLTASMNLIVTTCIILLFVQFFIIKPLKTVLTATQEVSKGNLKVQVSYRSKDELGQLSSSFNQMIENLRNLIVDMNHASDFVAQASDQLSHVSKSVVQSFDPIVENVNGMAKGAETQVAVSQESSRALEEMAAGVQKIAETSSFVSELSLTTLSEAEKGNEAINRVKDQMQDISQSVNDSASIIYKMSELSEKITGITKMISEIASQTSLLALNASIEAARAGEDGKGFAVVANEVKKLASQTENSAAQISEIIGQVDRVSTDAVQSMKKGVQEVQKGIEIAIYSGEAFEKILDAVKNVSVHIEEVAATAEQMAASSEEVSASVTELSGIATGTSDKANHAAISTKEQLKEMDRILTSAESLAEMAAQLKQTVGKFLMA
ncbi:methyl-accepting chemotaxis protein [Paenibacillus senegalensis]|uniref:methyl-accepting chemotaxis protein n=1 Tax=Paenibacillus senegalensis TaxID=1465766 RepID=UPI0002899486|nr:HAMP domain-containing methyl-accepting chemotaxis protein [Paenibacillus senegalensis]